MSNLLITGAGSGIGKELVVRAVERGDTVFATLRSAQGLRELEGRKNLHLVIMDVGDSDSVTKGFSEVDRLLSGALLDGVVHCAAVSPLGALEVLPLAVFEDTLNTNTLGTLRVMQAAIPRLRGHGGRLILTTSLWGKVAGPMLSAYCASKHAIEALVDSARRETKGMGLHITVVEPGVIKTRMLFQQVEESQKLAESVPAEHQALYGELYRKYAGLVAKGAGQGISVGDCAAQIEKVLQARAPKARYRIGPDAKAVCFLARILPDRALDGMFAMMMK
jgi:NAD(P)-dependent dehydrogenase (short-subunit alcohol dehydrogenase family)